MNDPAVSLNIRPAGPSGNCAGPDTGRPFKRSDDLLDALHLDPGIAAADTDFPLLVPQEFVARMRSADVRDPLLRQVLPSEEESRQTTGYSADPVGDLASAIAPGVLKKYPGRALLIVTGACAIHCRYCFRRAFPYAENALSRQDARTAVDTIAADPDLEEIILSGGDPLSLSNRRIAALIDALAAVDHVRRLRIHTRIPVVTPARVDTQLSGIMARCPLPVIVVLHCNHADEIDAAVTGAVGRLRDAGVWLLNQSVLLKGVNDSPEALASLSERLFEIDVMPYYLHQLDPVAGAAHFSVDDARAVKIIDAVADRLPGYLVPKLVREVPGESAKKPVHALLENRS